jgi:transposase
MKKSPSNYSKGITLGLDLGDKRHAYCVLSESGKILTEGNVSNTAESLTRLIKGFLHPTVVMETGTHSPWISRHFQSEGCKVIVANARKVHAISRSNRKNDKEDARMLARLGRVDPTLLSPIRHRSERCQRDLVRIKARDSLVRTRVNLINTIRFTLKSLGIKVPGNCSAKRFTVRCRDELDSRDVELVEPLLQMVEHCNRQITQQEAQLNKISMEQYPETLRLRQVRGVGPITALCFVLTIESHQRFAHARDVGAYLGLVPRQDQSGQTDKQLRITKAGNAHLRCLLVNCAHYILGPFGPPTDLRQAGLSLCQRGGANSKKKAAIATARKLAVTLLALWKSGQDYVPLKEAPVQQAA